MKKVTTQQQGRACYAAPLLEQIDVQPEKGFATSYPGGDVENASAIFKSYDDFYLDNE